MKHQNNLIYPNIILEAYVYNGKIVFVKAGNRYLINASKLIEYLDMGDVKYNFLKAEAEREVKNGTK